MIYLYECWSKNPVICIELLCLVESYKSDLFDWISNILAVKLGTTKTIDASFSRT